MTLSHNEGPRPDADHQAAELDKLAELPQSSFFAEFVQFLRNNKKWWLIPLVASLLLVGAVSLLSTSGAAPFIYSIF